LITEDRCPVCNNPFQAIFINDDDRVVYVHSWPDGLPDPVDVCVDETYLIEDAELSDSYSSTMLTAPAKRQIDELERLMKL
jgi:hypothetical protein